ncbi:MAG: hypothetical protein ACPGMR_03225 [Pontibacterium sp.]
MGFFSRMFSGDNSAAKAIDMVRDAGDALVFTEEEKQAANQKVLDWVLAYMQATNGQNIARRFIALVVVLVWALMAITIGVLAVIAGYADSEGALAASKNLMEVMRELALEPINIVLAFYFLTASIRSWKSPK